MLFPGRQVGGGKDMSSELEPVGAEQEVLEQVPNPMETEEIPPRLALQGAQGQNVTLLLRDGFTLYGKHRLIGEVYYVGEAYVNIVHGTRSTAVSYSNIKRVVSRSLPR